MLNNPHIMLVHGKTKLLSNLWRRSTFNNSKALLLDLNLSPFTALVIKLLLYPQLLRMSIPIIGEV